MDSHSSTALLVLLGSLVLSVLSQDLIYCPEAPIPDECSCNDEQGLTCTGLEDGSTWDVKSTFDNISAAVGSDRMLNGVTIGAFAPLVIEAGTITDLKILVLNVDGTNHFSRLDVEAFPGTYEYTQSLVISRISFVDDSNKARFEFLNKFQSVVHIELSFNILQEIPERAFEGVSSLQSLSFHQASVRRIQGQAFAGHPNLSLLMFHNCELTDETISIDAFKDMRADAEMHLYEPLLTHLPQDKFKEFLDNSKSLTIGSGNVGKPEYFLYCDTRASWICDKGKNYTSKLFGYYCRDSTHNTVFDYCDFMDNAGNTITTAKPQPTQEENQLLITSALFILCLLISLVGYVVFTKRVRNRKLLRLEKEFRKGVQDVKTGLSNNDQKYDWLPALPYIEDYEIPPKNIIIDEVVGAGNFGTVHIGRLKTQQGIGEDDYVTFTPVAIKRLRKEQRSIENLKPLCNELRVMMTIRHTLESHPNIVAFIGAITTSFSKCEISIVMEVCENGNLKKYLSLQSQRLINRTITQNESEVTISPEAYKWCFEIADGMRFLAANKILHIDLAARNVLLTASNTAKISDFGSSRELREKKDYYKTRGEVSFHQNWTALEVLKGGSFTIQSDVWSYGVTLWEIFNLGCDPNYEPDIDIQLQLEKGTRLSPPIYGDQETKQIIAKCWNQNPENRPNFIFLNGFFRQKFGNFLSFCAPY